MLIVRDQPQQFAASGMPLPGPSARDPAALQRPDQVAATVERGFTFIALGSDGGLVANGMATLADAFTPYRMHVEEE